MSCTPEDMREFIDLQISDPSKPPMPVSIRRVIGQCADLLSEGGMVLAVLPADEKHTSARALYLSPPFDPDADQPWENYATDTMELCFSGMYCMISMTASVMRMPQRERGINAPSLEASSIRILEKSANEYFKAFSELRPLGFDVEIKLTPKAMPKAGGGA